LDKDPVATYLGYYERDHRMLAVFGLTHGLVNLLYIFYHIHSALWYIYIWLVLHVTLLYCHSLQCNEYNVQALMIQMYLLALYMLCNFC